MGIKIEIQSPFKFLREKSVNINDPNYQAPTINGLDNFYPLSAQVNLSPSRGFDCKTVQGQALAYAYNPVVSGIINMRAQSTVMGKWSVVDSDGNYKPTPFDKILSKPNLLQSFSQLINNASVFKDIFGRCYLYPVKPTRNSDPSSVSSIWVVPNWMVVENYSGKWMHQRSVDQIITSYTVQGIGELMPDELIIWDDTGINTNPTNTQVVSYQSRLSSLSDQVSNINRAYEARRKIITKGGPPGAWVNNNPTDPSGRNPKSPQEIEDMQQFLMMHGVGNDNPYFHAVLQSAWTFVSAGSPTKDLMLFEEVEDDALMVGHVYDVPDTLIPWNKNKTYNNLKTDEKRFYTNSIIPAAKDLADVLTSWFKLDKYGVSIQVYYDHLECFQVDRKAEADALASFSNALSTAKTANALTATEYRKLWAQFLPSNLPDGLFDPENPDGDLQDGNQATV